MVTRILLLIDHIASDPDGRGYAGMNRPQKMASLNLERSFPRAVMTGAEVKAAVVLSDYAALTDAKKLQLLALTARDDLDPFGLGEEVIKDIFGAGSDTLIALAGARVKTSTDGNQIGYGFVNLGDLAEAGF